MAIVLATGIAIFLGINATMNVGETSAEQILHLLCETGDKNLDQYFEGIEKSVKLASSYIEDDLSGTDPQDLPAHVDRVREVVGKIAGETAGVLTYYYRIDPVYSDKASGLWYVDMDSRGFTEHEVTDISSYDTSDTSQLVWFTVPKSTGKALWLPPYVTDNLDVLVLSYNMPIYKNGHFVGVFGIELDYTTLANQVNNIKLYDNGYAFINDKDGNIVYHPYIDVARMAPEDRPRVPEGLLSNKSDIHYFYEGVEKQAVWLELNNGMRLNVTVPVSEINGNWKGLVVKILIVAGILLIVFILVALHFTGHITKPLKEFKEVAEQVEAGNYDVEMNYHGNDEIGVLSNTFNHMIGNMKDYISELNRLNDHLKEDNLSLEAATTKDSLTGVRNRFALRRDYELYVDRNIHIMMVDIDDFKKVNDTYGHSVGDYLLRKVGDALLNIFGFEYSYRYGGDEFLVIIPDMKDEDFRAAMDDLKNRLEESKLEDQRMPVHFSAGYVYGRTTLQDDLRLMLRQADELLYKTKGSGKHGFTGRAYDRQFAEVLKKRAEEDFRRG